MVMSLYRNGDSNIDKAFHSSGNVITARFKPILRGYIQPGPGYEKDRVIRDQVESTCLFKQDLNVLDEKTTWMVERDEAGAFSINRLK